MKGLLVAQIMSDYKKTLQETTEKGGTQNSGGKK